MEGHRKFLGGRGGGLKSPNFRSKVRSETGISLGGGGGAKQKPSVGGVWIFSGTAHSEKL